MPPAESISGTLRAGHGLDDLHVGSSRAEAMAYFGCEPSGEHAGGRILSYLGYGVVVRLDAAGYVEALTFGPSFRGDGLAFPPLELPAGLAWQMLMPDVRDLLGEPDAFTTGEVVEGSGRRHHVADWPGLRLTFDDQGRLITVTVRAEHAE